MRLLNFRKIQFILLFLLLSSCATKLSIEGFDSKEWKEGSWECTNYRKKNVSLLLKNEEYLLARTQNEIEDFLGKATEHELYDRNQKFFHYKITPSCEKQKVHSFLSIRFNAIGRSSSIQLIKRTISE